MNNPNRMNIAKSACKLIENLKIELRVTRRLFIEIRKITSAKTFYNNTLKATLIIND